MVRDLSYIKGFFLFSGYTRGLRRMGCGVGTERQVTVFKAFSPCGDFVHYIPFVFKAMVKLGVMSMRTVIMMMMMMTTTGGGGGGGLFLSVLSEKYHMNSDDCFTKRKD